MQWGVAVSAAVVLINVQSLLISLENALIEIGWSKSRMESPSLAVADGLSFKHRRKRKLDDSKLKLRSN